MFYWVDGVGERSEISNLLFRDISTVITENKDNLKPF
jgi:hypothetical protein